MLKHFKSYCNNKAKIPLKNCSYELKFLTFLNRHDPKIDGRRCSTNDSIKMYTWLQNNRIFTKTSQMIALFACIVSCLSVNGQISEAYPRADGDQSSDWAYLLSHSGK